MRIQLRNNIRKICDFEHLYVDIIANIGLWVQSSYMMRCII